MITFYGVLSTVMNPGHVMPRPVRRLGRLVLYKDMKVFEYAINGAENCENHKLHFHVNLEKHVHIKNLKNKYVYKLKYKIVRLKIRRTI